MRKRQLEAIRVLVATALVALMPCCVASAQNVGALRQTSYDLLQTDLDREVLMLF